MSCILWLLSVGYVPEIVFLGKKGMFRKKGMR